MVAIEKKKYGEALFQIGIYALTAVLFGVILSDMFDAIAFFAAITLGVLLVVIGTKLIKNAQETAEQQKRIKGKHKRSVKLLKNTVVTFEEQ